MVTILVADDSASIRQFLKQELEEEGYRVIVARDGKEAVDVVRAERPDLAILDICMPRVNGFEAAERIVAVDADIAIVFHTNNDELCIHDRRNALAAACVEKGEDLTELKLAVISVLARRNGDNLFRRGLPPIEECRAGVPRCQSSGATLPQPWNR